MVRSAANAQGRPDTAPGICANCVAGVVRPAGLPGGRLTEKPLTKRAPSLASSDILITRLNRPDDGQTHAAARVSCSGRRIALRASRITSAFDTVDPAANSASAHAFS